MPLYEFVCQKCQRQFEDLVFGRAKSACPGCQSTDVERVLSVVSVGRSGSSSPAPASLAPSSCGSCGDPRGPGSCRSN